MALINFSVVLLGESFPVQAIKSSDFLYRHRELNESLRLPVAVQAENNLVAMQVLPDRFDVRVKTPDEIEKQVEGVVGMVETFLDYVGRRTITAVGHNAQWVVAGGHSVKSLLTSQFVNSSAIEKVVGVQPLDVDLGISFKVGAESRARVALSTDADGDSLLDFNFHFDTSNRTDVELAISEMSASLRHIVKIGNRMDNLEGVVSQ